MDGASAATSSGFANLSCGVWNFYLEYILWVFRIVYLILALDLLFERWQHIWHLLTKWLISTQELLNNSERIFKHYYVLFYWSGFSMQYFKQIYDLKFSDFLTDCTQTLQGNCCGLSIYLKLLHSTGGVSSRRLHHHAGLLLSQSSSLSSQSSLLGGELTGSWWHPSAPCACLLWHSIGSCCGSGQLDPSRKWSEKTKLFLEAASGGLIWVSISLCSNCLSILFLLQLFNQPNIATHIKPQHKLMRLRENVKFVSGERPTILSDSYNNTELFGRSR